MKLLEAPYKRSDLNEGRDYGIGFSVLKADSANNLKPLFPFTACKDYLNDVIYVEQSGKNIDEVYGFRHEFMNYFQNKKRLILGVAPLQYIEGEKRIDDDYIWENYDDCSSYFTNNSENFINVLHYIEIMMNGTSKLTKLLGIVDNTWILELNPIWQTTGPAISFFTLFARCYFNFKDSPSIENIKAHTPYIMDDEMMKINILDILDNLDITENIFNTDIYLKENEESSSNTIHNLGVSNFYRNIKKSLAESSDSEF